MSQASGLRMVKAIAIALVSALLTFFGTSAALALASEDKAVIVADVLAHYNHKLTRPQADELAGLVLRAGERFKLAPLLIASIIVRESGARPWAISKGGDYGLMQVRWRVHKERIRKQYPQVRGASDLLRPEINIFFGAELFAEYYAKRGTIRGGLLRYSAGNKVLADRVLATLGDLRKAYRNQERGLTSK